MDVYDGFHPGQRGDEEVARAKAEYEVIFAALAPHQQVMLVPGTFGCSNATVPGLPASVSDAQVATKLEAYFAWMKTDKRIAGINPWHWNDRGHSQHGKEFCDMTLGAGQFPETTKVLRAIGKWIVFKNTF